MRRNAGIAILVCLLAVFAWRAQSCGGQIAAKRRAAAAETARFLERTADEPSPLPLDPHQRRAGLADAYRLRPDRRFLLAFEAVARFTATPAEPVTVSFHDGAWVLAAGKQDLGRVPELSGFGDLFLRLVAFAHARLPSEPSVVRVGARRILPWEDEARAELPAALARWRSERSRDALSAASRASAALVFYAVDLFEVSDRLPAQALALAALLEAGGGDASGAKAILASTLGYGQEARTIAPRLKSEPTLRAYLLGDDAALAEAARLREATPVDRYLLVRRAYDHRDVEIADGFLDSFHGVERFTLPVLAQRLRDRRMQGYAQVAYSLPVFLLAAAEGNQVLPKEVDRVDRAAAEIAAQLGLERQDPSQRLEAALGKLDEDSRAWFRALQMSAIHRMGDFYAADQADRNRSEQFSGALKRHPSAEVRDYQKWFAARTSLMRSSPLEALAAVESLKGVGGAAVVDLLDEARKRASFGDPRVLRAVRTLVARLDTRPYHRAKFGEIAWTELQDLRLADKLLGSALKADPGRYLYLEEWFAQLRGDGAWLLRLVGDRSAPTSIRSKAADHLFELGGAHAGEAERAARALVAEQPHSTEARYTLGRMLRLSGRLLEGRKVLADWLRADDGPTLAAAIMRGGIAHYDYLMAHYQEGWAIAEPALESWAASPMTWGALNLAGLGRADDARRIAVNLLSRYPSAHSLGTAAEIEWRLGDAAAAVKLFHDPSVHVAPYDYRDAIGEHFSRIYAARPVDDAVHAVLVLLPVIDRMSLDELGTALADAKAYEHASAVHAKLSRGVQGASQFFLLLRAADALEKARGVKPAREWLAKQISGPLSDSDTRDLGLVGFLNGWPGAVWDLATEPKAADEHAENFWMLRAAAVALQGPAAPAERRDALHRHYAAAKPVSHYDALGRYLIGELPESEVAKLVTNHQRACEVPYYFAVKAVGEKRFGDASDWYHVALECGRREEAEYRFAQADLYRWRAEKNPFAKLDGAAATAGAPR